MYYSAVHVGDVSTLFKVTILDEDGNIVDVSGASTKNIIFHKPKSGAKVTKTALFVTDGTDGKIYYRTVAGDIDKAGTWKLQAYVDITGQGKWYSEIAEFEVEMNL